ncbi:MAG: hypothetical protein KR126chlam5_01274 [Candidatus Anoxychlamydiales bacterium]|nr:hypothetical protein [Candidatus Anoxychlamydiales bacterium]
MNKLFILILCFIHMAIFANDSYVISNYKNVDAAVDILTDEDLPIEKKAKAAEQVFFNPGSFHPAALLAAGVYFLYQKDFEKGALLSIGAILRTEIDIRISRDVSLGGVPSIFLKTVEKIIREDYHFTVIELNAWQSAKVAAINNFEVWDRNTPRDYDQTWVLPHSINAFNPDMFDESEPSLEERDKKIIIDRFYRELRNETSEEDDFFACREDEYYFDRKTRIFFLNESPLSFFVPDNIEPQLDSFGEYATVFKLHNNEYIHIDDGWSSLPQSLEKDYQMACSNDSAYESATNESYESDTYEKSETTYEKCIVGNNIEAYKERYIHKDRDPYSTAERSCIDIKIHFVKGHYCFNFYFSCSEENEKESLENMELLLSYIEFSSE